MSGRLERRYRRLLVAYPAAYRAAHGDEISDPAGGRGANPRFPAPREAAGLLLGGCGPGPARRVGATPRGCARRAAPRVLPGRVANLSRPCNWPGPMDRPRRRWRPAVLRLGPDRAGRTALAALAAARPLLPPVGRPGGCPGTATGRRSRATPCRRRPGRPCLAAGRPAAASVRGGGCCCRSPSWRSRRWSSPGRSPSGPGWRPAPGGRAGGRGRRRRPRPRWPRPSSWPRPVPRRRGGRRGCHGAGALVYWTVVAMLTVGLAAVAWRIRRVQLRER